MRVSGPADGDKISKNNISNTDTQDSGGAILNMAPMKPTCPSGYDVKLIHVPHNLGGGEDILSRSSETYGNTKQKNKTC